MVQSADLSAVCSDKIYANSGNLPLLGMLPAPRGGRRVLDCGCGAGDNARLLAQAGWRVTGITISAEENALASRFCESTLVADLEQGLPRGAEGPYDIILMSHLLEHLINPMKLLETSRRVLSPDGLLAVALPNILAYPQRLAFLCGNFEYTDTGTMDHTHVRFYTFSTGRRLLTTNGYDVTRAEPDGGFPLWKLRFLLPDPVVRAINRTACRAAPNLFGFQSLYLARPIV